MQVRDRQVEVAVLGLGQPLSSQTVGQVEQVQDSLKVNTSPSLDRPARLWINGEELDPNPRFAYLSQVYE